MIHQVNPLYPTANNLNEALNALMQNVTPAQRNQLFSYLMVYHNTLLMEQQNEIRPKRS